MAEQQPSVVVNGSTPPPTVSENGSTMLSEPTLVSLQFASAIPALPGPPKNYGRVIISLDNPILPREMIELTPSRVDGLDLETETALRITGCRLIQLSGTLLKLPQTAMATAQVLFQRYYYSKSLVRFPMEFTSMACVVLASKVEEAPRRVRDVVNVFNNIKQIRLKQPKKPMALNETYVALKNQVIKMERRILKELGFCVHVKHPHKFIVTVAQILNNHENTELIQAAWNYMNDSLQTNVFVRYPPEMIACACIHLSSRILRVPLPVQPAWYLLFNTTTDAIEDICKTILTIYAAKLPSQEVLEQKVAESRRMVDEAKIKAREKSTLESNRLDINDSNTMDSLDSRPTSPNVVTLLETKDSLHNLSVINRLKKHVKEKQANEMTKREMTPPVVHGRLKSTVVQDATSNANSNKEDFKRNEPESMTPEAFRLKKSPTEEDRHSSVEDYSSGEVENGEDRRRRRRRGNYEEVEEDGYRRGERERYRNGSRHRSDADDYDSAHRRRRSYSRDEDERYKSSSYRTYKAHRSPEYHSSSSSHYHGKSSSGRHRASGEYEDERYRRRSRSRSQERYREREKYRGYKSNRDYK